jgi:hypothetical protein
MWRTLAFHFRKYLSSWKRCVPPEQWLMNLEVPAYTLPFSEETKRLQAELEVQYPLMKRLPLSWAWVLLESWYQLAQIQALFSSGGVSQQAVSYSTCDWVDVGSKNGATLPACLAAAETLGQNVSLTAVEIDAYRHYLDGYTRGDYARGIVQGLKDLTAHSMTWVEADMVKYAEHDPE